MKILHMITSLEAAGAQWVLVHLLEQLKIKDYTQAVVCMSPEGELAQQVLDLGIPLFEIPVSARSFITAKSKCRQVISTFQPDVIQSWMYHADFLTLLLPHLHTIPVVWGIHHSFENSRRNRLKWSTKMIVRANALFSRTVPRKIICCSQSALISHEQIGFDASKLVYIPNGVDVDRFQPDLQARLILRNELDLPPNTRLIGYIARYHPQKDHDTFFKAAQLALETTGSLHFVLAGDGICADNPEIKKWMKVINRPDCFHFLGRRSDIPMITAGFDVATLTSSGDEAFPLTIIEAMACEIPCVATDVGDVKEMLKSTGIIVPPEDEKSLSEGWLKILNFLPAERRLMGEAYRTRILNHFTNESMAQKYSEVYEMVGNS